jgi:putative membrane protein
MKKITLGAALMLLAACALLAAAATAGAGGGQNTNSGKTEGGTSANANAKANANVKANANRGTASMSSDTKFATAAALGGMLEVELGRVAAQKGASDEVRQFGQHMVDDHSKANQDLTQVASAKGLSLPAALDARHQAEVQKLSALSGDKFDQEYVSMMIKDHRKDTAEFQKESTGGADADIKSFAARTLPVVRDHLQMIQRIHDKMALRKSGNLKTITNVNAGAGMGANMNSDMNSNAGGGANSNRGKSNKNKNSNTGSNSNNSNM